MNRALRHAGAALVAAVVPAAPLAASIPERDPFHRLPTGMLGAPEAAPVELRMAGSVFADGRALALLVPADGVGRVVEVGSVLPEMGVRVVRLDSRSVGLARLDDGHAWSVALDPGVGTLPAGGMEAGR